MKRAFVRLLLWLMLLAVPAAAGVIFDNFPIDGTTIGFLINGPQSISDSFSVGSGATVNGVNFGVWLFPGDSIVAVDWSIGTAPFGISSGSGTAAVSSTNPHTGAQGYTVATATFAFTDLNRAAVTYYLTLQNAVDSIGGFTGVFWDENSGPGVDAWYDDGGAIGRLSDPWVCAPNNNCRGTDSESFQILGSVQTIPEPSTWALLGLGILAAFAPRRKAIRRAATHGSPLTQVGE